jgi:hypothetical protein
LICRDTIHGWETLVDQSTVITTSVTCGPPFDLTADGQKLLASVLTTIHMHFSEELAVWQTGPVKPNAHATSGGIDDLGGGALRVADGGTGLTSPGASLTALSSDGSNLSWIPAAFIFNGLVYLPVLAVPPVLPPAMLPGLAPAVLVTAPPSIWAYLAGAWHQLGGGGPPPAGNIEDLFVDPNGTALSAHTIAPTNVPMATWIDLSAAWNIQSNSAALIASGTDRWVVCDSLAADRTVEVQATLFAGDYAGLAMRMTDPMNGWYLYAGQPSNLLYLEQIVAGARAVVASGPIVVPLGVAQSIKAVMVGNTISGYYNNVLIFAYAGAVFQNGITTHGMYSYLNTARLNDWKCGP